LYRIKTRDFISGNTDFPLKVKSDRFVNEGRSGTDVKMLIKFIKNTLFLLSNQEWYCGSAGIKECCMSSFD
jgi:hypothetical protein